MAVGAIFGLASAGAATTAVCVGLSVPTGGLGGLTCGIVVVGMGSYASSKLGSAVGEDIGEVIYEATQ
jgi:hypothetical protein